MLNVDGWPVLYWWVKSKQYWNLPKRKVTRWINHCSRVILNILNKRNNSLSCLLGSKDWTENMRFGWRLRSFWKTVSSTLSSMIATVNDMWTYFHNFNVGCHNYVHVVTLCRDYSHETYPKSVSVIYIIWTLFLQIPRTCVTLSETVSTALKCMYIVHV